MAKVSSIQKNLKRKRLVVKYAAKREKLKAIVVSAATLQEKLEAQEKLNKLPRNSSKVRVRNRCSLTGKPRGVYRKFGMCRNKIRELAHNGFLPGVKKSSW